MTRGARGEVTIRVEGDFDPSEAGRLVGWLREVPPHEPLVIDFAGARHRHDFGFATFAGELAGRTQLTVRGLSRHQEKLLRYFGVELREPEEIRAAG